MLTAALLLWSAVFSHRVQNARPPLLLKRVEPKCGRTVDDPAAISTLEAVVGNKGQIGQICIVRGTASNYTRWAAEALKQWEFRPGTLNDQPAAVPLDFHVQGCSLTGPLPVSARPNVVAEPQGQMHLLITDRAGQPLQ